LQQARLAFGCIAHSCLLVVQPSGSDMELAVPRPARFLDRTGTWLFVRDIFGRYPVRTVTQPEQKVVSYICRKEIGRRADIADAATRNRERNAVDVGLANDQPPAGRSDEAGKKLRHKVSAAAALADDRYIGANGKFEIDRLEQMNSVAVHHIDIRGSDLAVDR